ncbi:MAG: sigma 54-interacting transcriptional regulator [Polyangiaceae bacterium]
MAKREDGFLLHVIGGGCDATHPLPSRKPVIVGRDASAQIVVPHASVSRAHLELLLVGDRVVVTDLGSHNGTLVGGVRIAPKQSTPVRPGVLLRAGEIVLSIEEPASAEPARDGEIVSPAMQRVLRLVDRVAPDDVTILVLGETGVGKEVLAERIHARSLRSAGPLVKIHCAALSPSLIESELFGHERGAFTGATTSNVGLLRAADKGTVFIDEVGEIPLELQVKLLRVLEDRRVTPVGGRAAEPIDVRFVAATHRDLRARAKTGEFREDLYYRLSGVTIDVPPLRERQEEILPLAERLLAQACAERKRPPARLSEAAREHLARHRWPGNIRELKAVMVRSLLLAESNVIGVDDLHLDAPEPKAAAPAVRAPNVGAAIAGESERDRIARALEASGGNQKEAAKLLGIARRTLLYKLDELDIPRPRKRTAE